LVIKRAYYYIILLNHYCYVFGLCKEGGRFWFLGF